VPLKVRPLGPKRPLRSELFNRTSFEQTLALGQQRTESKENRLPADTLPRYLEGLYGSEITLTVAGGNRFKLPSMLAMALTLSKDRIPALTDSQTLGGVYRKAYRLMFATAMTEVLKTDFSSAVEETPGQRMVEIEAVLLEPVFTYLVVGFLIAVSISGIAMLFISIYQKSRIELPDNPGKTSPL
jgi:hypothetical protein